MKQLFQRNTSQIIFGLPEKSFATWVTIVVIHTLQHMEIGLSFMASISPHNSIFYYLQIPFGLFSLRTLANIFPNTVIPIQLLFLIVALLIIVEFFSGRSKMGHMFLYTDITYPCILSITVSSINSISPVPVLAQGCLVIFLALALGLVRILFINQDFSSREARISNIKSIVSMMVYTTQTFLLLMTPTPTIVLVFMLVSVCLHSVSFLVSFFLIENINEELEYLFFLKCSFLVTFYACLFSSSQRQGLDFMCIFGIIFQLFNLRAGLLKSIFEYKYDRLLSKLKITQTEEDLVIILEVVQDMSSFIKEHQSGCELKAGQCRSKRIEFGFRSKARELCVNLLLKKMRESGGTMIVESFLHEYPAAIIQRLLSERLRSKSKLPVMVLTSLYVKKNSLIRALYINESLQGQLDRSTRIMQKLLKLKIQQGSVINDRIGDTLMDNNNICALGIEVTRSKVDQIMKLQDYIEEFIRQMSELSSLTTKFLTKISSKTINSDLVVKVIEKQAQLKTNILQLHSKFKGVISKEIVICNYIFYRHFCSQKHTAFQSIIPFVDRLNKVALCKSLDSLVCVVSAAQSNRGTIILANHRMAQFFDMDFEHIKQGTKQLENYLPKPLSVIHNDLIASALNGGISAIIGKRNTFFMVKGKTCYPVDFLIKFQPYLDGINFSCEVNVLKDQAMILYDQSNEILGFTPTAQSLLSKRKLEFKYVHDVFPPLRGSARLNENKSECSEFCILQRRKEPKYTLAAKLYDSPNIHMGICKFIRNQSPSQYHANSESNLINSRIVNPVKTVASTTIRFQKEHDMILEHKIKYMPHPIFIPRCKYVITSYSLVIIVLIIYFFLSLVDCIDESILECQMINTVFGNNIQNIVLGFNRITILRIALFNGNFPASTSDIPDTNQFIQDQYSTELANLKDLKLQLLGQLQNLPIEYVELFSDSDVQFLTLSNTTVPMTLMSYLSAVRVVHLEERTKSEKEFTKNITRKISRSAFTVNNGLVDLTNNIYKAISNAVRDNRIKGSMKLKSILIQVLGVSTFGICILGFLLHKNITEKIRFLELLRCLENKNLNDKMLLTQQISRTLLEIVKTPMHDVNINSDSKVLQFRCSKHNAHFQHANIHINDLKEEDEVKDSLFYTKQIERKEICHSRFLLKQYGIIAVIASTFLFIFGVFIAGYVVADNCIDRNKAYFQDLAEQNFNLTFEVAAVLSANLALVTNSSQKSFFNMPVSNFVNQTINSIVNRRIDTVLEDFYPCISRNDESRSQIFDYMYSSKCAADDSLCQEILSGTLTRGVFASIISFTGQSLQLYNSMIASPASSTDFESAGELLVGYSNYIREMLKISGFILGLIQDLMRKAIVEMNILLGVTLVIVLALIVQLVVVVAGSRSQIGKIKEAVFTILSVDLLVKNINYNYEIKNIY